MQKLSFKGIEGLRFDPERPFYHTDRMLRYANERYDTTVDSVKDIPTQRNRDICT